MVSTKRINLILILLLLGLYLVPVSGALAIEDTPTPKPDESEDYTEAKGQAIMLNCGNIRHSLTQLQRADSRTRTYLGSAYETISGRFITPLNLRMVKNGTPSTELFRIQNDFTAQQNYFRDTYVGYMRELEGLIATDCSASPEEFYHKLKTVRAEREKLHQITQQISKLVDEQYKAVEEVKAAL